MTGLNNVVRTYLCERDSMWLIIWFAAMILSRFGFLVSFFQSLTVCRKIKLWNINFTLFSISVVIAEVNKTDMLWGVSASKQATFVLNGSQKQMFQVGSAVSFPLRTSLSLIQQLCWGYKSPVQILDASQQERYFCDPFCKLCCLTNQRKKSLTQSQVLKPPNRSLSFKVGKLTALNKHEVFKWTI